MREFDLLVIGGGSAGLKAARTAARMGHTVAVAEERELGGECFWAGCVPTKAMVRAAQVWHQVRVAGEFGVQVERMRADFAAVMAYKRRAVQRVGGEGPEDGGLSKQGIAYYPHHAVFEGADIVRMGLEAARARQILLATGTVPEVPPIPGLAEAGYLTNREAVELETLPRRLLVIGAGPIGLEFAQVFRRFGAEVTVVEIGPQILPREDEEIASLAAGYLREEGIRILTNAFVERVSHQGEAKAARVHAGGAVETVLCDQILVAAGRTAAVAGMNLAAAGVEVVGKSVWTDAFLRTKAPHVWAAGDVTGRQLFTHVASYEGQLVAQNMFCAAPQPFDHRFVPRCTYLDPEVASIGLTEREARALGREVAVYAFPFALLDRAILHNEPKGLVKLTADKTTGTLLGAHLIGHEASSLLGEAALAVRHGLPLSAITDTMHAYPSFPEAIEAAALSGPRR